MIMLTTYTTVIAVRIKARVRRSIPILAICAESRPGASVRALLIGDPLHEIDNAAPELLILDLPERLCERESIRRGKEFGHIVRHSRPARLVELYPRRRE
jgi:hypothetical protein